MFKNKLFYLSLLLSLFSYCDINITLNGDLAGARERAAIPVFNCGDGILETGEACDTSGVDAFDCNGLICTTPVCGDGYFNSAAGEACDTGGNSATCDLDCTVPACGDSIINTAAGEQCDDGNTANDDGCSSTCQNEACGDGIAQASEECDDGNLANGDGCDSNCITEFCGNGITQAGEVCDTAGNTLTCDSDCTAPTCNDGIYNNLAEPCESNGVDSGTCDADCTIPACNDGHANVAAGEECDSSGVDTSACNGGSCTAAACGDGYINIAAGESCDDGNTVGNDGCSATCITECGDGAIQASETCDDSNLANGDGCDSTCQSEVCGNSLVQFGETCDDGNAITEICAYGATSCTVCNATCQSTAGATSFCGDGATDIGNGEACDDGNVLNDDGCSSTCAIEACGDNIVQTGEECDDGNNTSGDGCDSLCVTEFCGDNLTNNVTETCDDGNAVTEVCTYGQTSCTVCNNTCQSAAGATSFCGDGATDAGNSETCDDGNAITEVCAYGATSCTVCDATCLSVAGATSFCGDGATDIGNGEACDDGNPDSNDGCSSTCLVESCGDFIVQTGEECDDGNNTSGDGCDSLCVTEFCGDNLTNNSTETCDDGNAVTEVCNYSDLSCTVCDATCQSVAGATSFCGDGARDAGNGEGCDDGNTTTEICVYGLTSCTVCDATCQSVGGATSFCGDNSLDIGNGEECDDGNVLNDDGCSSTCAVEACGDSIVQSGEECDDGGTVSGDGCDSLCVTEFCGDNLTNNVTETCDDGNTVTEACAYSLPSCTVCDATCQSVAGATSSCGDSVKNGPEFCDSGGTDTAGCDGADCTDVVCGDGYVNSAAEGCDDGNTTSGDGCDGNCAIELTSAAPLDTLCGQDISATQNTVCGDAGCQIPDARQFANSYCQIGGFAGVAHLTSDETGATFTCHYFDLFGALPTSCLDLVYFTNGYGSDIGCPVAVDVNCFATNPPPPPPGAYIHLKGNFLMQPNGTPLSNWPDLSGNSNTPLIAIGGQEPVLIKPSTLDGFPVLRFNGTSSALPFLGAQNLSSGTGFSVIVVAKSNSVATVGAHYAFVANNPANMIMIGSSAGPDFNYIVNGTTIANTPAGDTAWHVHEITVSALAATAYRDGVALNAAVGVGNFGINAMAIGARNSGGAYDLHWNGEIAEVIIYNGPLTGAQRTSVMDYLKTKYPSLP